jgi:hypothetical protein
MADRGGRAHITYDSGAHAFVTGGRKEYFVFQFDLVFTRGRIQIGNDLDSVLVPGPSPRYTGFAELTTKSRIEPLTDTAKPPLRALIDALDQRSPAAGSVRQAIDALRLGVAVFQSGVASGTPVRHSEVRTDLTLISV